MIMLVIAFVLMLALSGYFMWRIHWIKSTGTILQGRIDHVKTRGAADGGNVYISTVVYTAHDGQSKSLRIHHPSKPKVSTTVDLHQYELRKKIHVTYLINWYQYLGFALFISIILMAAMLTELSEII